MGLNWKAKLVESQDALKQADATIRSLKQSNEKLLQTLEEAKRKVRDRNLSANIDAARNSNEAVIQMSDKVQSQVTQTIQTNDPAVQRALSSPSFRKAIEEGRFQKR